MTPPSSKIEWFELLIELTPQEQAQSLADLHRIQPELAAQLRALLAIDAAESTAATESNESTRFDTTSLSAAITGAVQARSSIPQFELLGLLGQGGMGEVWRAKRVVAGVAQIVALKILKLESDSSELQERFALEQRTLLKLTHPNIARLLDAGTADDGRPWIAMELVQGLPITEYCDLHKLNVPARLKLFRQVIAAVQYAHDYFIVHRDIKPDNVLVDESGCVKLLDFGIAKSLDRHAPHTLTQQRFFSLYATAPEQLLGNSVCVGTDVYALGGLLYELLSGAPLISRELKTPAQLQAFIVEKTPTVPSKIADASAAANRSAANIAKLSAHLRGDLDRIVLHALRKLPSERYASAREFDDDIVAYLALRPVKAAGQGQGYRAKKFLRRHWLAASVSALALSGLLTLTVLLAWRGNQLLLSKNQLQASNVVALSQQTRAEQITRVLTDAFQAADPSQNRGNEVKAREVLDQAARRLDVAELDADAFVKLSVTLANVYRSLGLIKEGQALAEAAKLQEQKVQSPDVRIQLLHLFARIYGESGKQALRVETVEAAGKVLGVTDPELLIDQRILEIELIFDDDKIAESVEQAKILDRQTANKFGATSKVAIKTALNYLNRSTAFGRGQNEVDLIAERLGNVVADLFNTDQLALVLERANIYIFLNRLNDAEVDVNAVESATLRLYGTNNRRYVSALSLRSRLLGEQKQYSQKKLVILNAQKILQNLYPPNFSIHALAMNNLASVEVDLGDFANAEKNARKAIALGEQNWGEKHRNLLTLRSTLASALMKQKKFAEAEKIYKLIIEQTKELDVNLIQPETNQQYLKLAEIYAITKRKNNALALLLEVRSRISKLSQEPEIIEVQTQISNQISSLQNKP